MKKSLRTQRKRKDGSKRFKEVTPKRKRLTINVPEIELFDHVYKTMSEIRQHNIMINGEIPSDSALTCYILWLGAYYFETGRAQGVPIFKPWTTFMEYIESANSNQGTKQIDMNEEVTYYKNVFRAKKTKKTSESKFTPAELKAIMLRQFTEAMAEPIAAEPQPEIQEPQPARRDLKRLSRAEMMERDRLFQENLTKQMKEEEEV